MEILHKFIEKFLRFLESTPRSSRYILIKFLGKLQKNLREVEKNILNNCRKIMETLLGKIEVIRN